MQWLAELIGWPWYGHVGVLVVAGLVFYGLFSLLFRVMGRLVPGLGRLRQKRLRRPIALALAAALVLTDVVRTGRTAHRLCREQGGVHIYKTVEAEGFLGASSIEYWSKYGFRYVEGGGTRGRKFRATIENGKVVDREVPEYISRYQWKGKENHVPVAPLIARSSSHVIDRRTGEELGTLVWFSIYPGWVERWLIGATFGDVRPWICGDRLDPSKPRYNNHYTYSDLVMAVIKPVRKSQGADK